ncbi:predicted protein [Plenodomus lingam JN3]|uniref:Predicted protein n=1 Tax=Leptosphaeria maculans (strain JN3 / isolate v23.1.3 / race Av1-4-5-6-7-8) TaxID=985895 RepID=E5A8C4_LEPMJ|nr:predicted protein [Plenodomus lingam JN3]CBX99869.1 predicted protein [Plenodomus lingam JN3]
MIQDIEMLPKQADLDDKERLSKMLWRDEHNGAP